MHGLPHEELRKRSRIDRRLGRAIARRWNRLMDAIDDLIRDGSLEYRRARCRPIPRHTDTDPEC